MAYAGMAPLAWMLWDMLISIEDEKECIWTRPGATWVKFAYGFLRYAPILQCTANIILELRVGDDFSSLFCKHFMIEKYIILMAVIMVVQASSAVRVYILFYEHDYALPVLFVLFSAEAIGMATTLGIVIRHLTFRPNCVVIGSLPTSNIVFWLATLVFEFFMFICNLVKFRLHKKETSPIGTPELLTAFSGQGISASLSTLAALLIGTIIHQLSNLSASRVGYNWTIAIISCTGANVLLNIRKFASNFSSGDHGDHTRRSFLARNLNSIRGCF